MFSLRFAELALATFLTLVVTSLVTEQVLTPPASLLLPHFGEHLQGTMVTDHGYGACCAGSFCWGETMTQTECDAYMGTFNPNQPCTSCAVTGTQGACCEGSFCWGEMPRSECDRYPGASFKANKDCYACPAESSAAASSRASEAGSSLSYDTVFGACCPQEGSTNRSCAQAVQSQCEDQWGGEFIEGGFCPAACAGNSSSAAWGACCHVNGSCDSNQTVSGCQGTFHRGETCQEAHCPQSSSSEDLADDFGACCGGTGADPSVCTYYMTNLTNNCSGIGGSPMQGAVSCSQPNPCETQSSSEENPCAGGVCDLIACCGQQAGDCEDMPWSSCDTPENTQMEGQCHLCDYNQTSSSTVRGACCSTVDFSCLSNNTTQTSCDTTPGGGYFYENQTCEDARCTTGGTSSGGPTPRGACCSALDFSCLSNNTTQASCDLIPGGSYFYEDQTCGDVGCQNAGTSSGGPTPRGACCGGAGPQCLQNNTTEENCYATLGGESFFEDQNCLQVGCTSGGTSSAEPPPRGACCSGVDFSCLSNNTTQASCDRTPGGGYFYEDQTCGDMGCGSGNQSSAAPLLVSCCFGGNCFDDIDYDNCVDWSGSPLAGNDLCLLVGCGGTQSSEASSESPEPETACADSQDNDNDGQTDCYDTDCSDDPVCHSTGVCCNYLGDICSLSMSNFWCTVLFGDYIPNGSCSDCQQPPSGACCSGDQCNLQTQGSCQGTFKGVGSTCSPQNPCLPRGACCSGESCLANQTLDTCTGTFQGAGTTCSPTNPCLPRGACCSGDACTLATGQTCQGTFKGAGSACSPENPCLPTGACCSGNSCAPDKTSETCQGTFQGAATTCSPHNPCLKGACCMGSLCAANETQQSCQGTFKGVGSTCSPDNPCLEKGACCDPSTSLCTEQSDTEKCRAEFYQYGIDFESCADTPCGARSACCFSNRDCFEIASGLCRQNGGTPHESDSCFDEEFSCGADLQNASSAPDEGASSATNQNSSEQEIFVCCEIPGPVPGAPAGPSCRLITNTNECPVPPRGRVMQDRKSCSPDPCNAPVTCCYDESRACIDRQGIMSCEAAGGRPLPAAIASCDADPCQFESSSSSSNVTCELGCYPAQSAGECGSYSPKDMPGGGICCCPPKKTCCREVLTPFGVGSPPQYTYNWMCTYGGPVTCAEQEMSGTAILRPGTLTEECEQICNCDSLPCKPVDDWGACCDPKTKYDPSPCVDLNVDHFTTAESERPQALCASYGGTFKKQSFCFDDPCDNVRACCTADGCKLLSKSACASQSGEYMENEKECKSSLCRRPCCTAQEKTCSQLTKEQCGVGEFLFSAKECKEDSCNRACCSAEGTCSLLSKQACEKGKGTFRPDAKECSSQGPNAACPLGICCYTYQGQRCDAQGGTSPFFTQGITEEQCKSAYRGYAPVRWVGGVTSCDLVNGQNPCLDPKGICCTGTEAAKNLQCLTVTETECKQFKGEYKGLAASCSECPSDKPACCTWDAEKKTSSCADAPKSGSCGEGKEMKKGMCLSDGCPPEEKPVACCPKISNSQCAVGMKRENCDPDKPINDKNFCEGIVCTVQTEKQAPCCVPGSPGATCEMLTTKACEAKSGAPQSAAACSPTLCDQQKKGACCTREKPDATTRELCLDTSRGKEMTREMCEELLDGDFKPGASCPSDSTAPSNPCNPTTPEQKPKPCCPKNGGACVLSAECDGEVKEGTSCEGISCKEKTGICCYAQDPVSPANLCDALANTYDKCQQKMNGSFRESLSACEIDTCGTKPQGKRTCCVRRQNDALFGGQPFFACEEKGDLDLAANLLANEEPQEVFCIVGGKERCLAAGCFTGPIEEGSSSAGAETSSQEAAEISSVGGGGTAGGGQKSSAADEGGSSSHEAAAASASSAPEKEKGNCCVEGEDFGLCFNDLDRESCEDPFIGGSFFGVGQCFESPSPYTNCGLLPQTGSSSSAEESSSSSQQSSASAGCGNGMVEEGEECDGGEANNDRPNALCRTNCTYSRCGDGIVDRTPPGGRERETCDDGELNSDLTSARCKLTCRYRNTFFTLGQWVQNLQLFAVKGIPIPNAPATFPGTRFITIGILTFLLL